MILLKAQSVEALETAVEYLDNISRALPSIIEDYREQNISTVSEKMINLSDGLRWLYDVAKLTKDYHSLDEDEMLGCYTEIVDAMEMKDYILISDLIEYELLPLVEGWRASLSESVKNLTTN